MHQVVFDASAAIALLREEPGAELIRQHVSNAAMSAVNYQELAKELIGQGFGLEEVTATLAELRLEIMPHDADDALLAASLVPATRKHGSGLGDRSCMALAIRLGAPALTTDRNWAKLEVPGLEVILAR